MRTFPGRPAILVAMTVAFLPLQFGPAAAAVIPADAECKAATEIATGGTPDHALQNWVSLTAALHGVRWSDWPAARDREVLPREHNGITVYQAVGTPCQAVSAK